MHRTLTALAIILAAPAAAQDGHQWGERNTDFEPAFPEQFRADIEQTDVELSQETIAGGLVHPWGVAPLPEGGFLVSERPGNLRHVAEDGTVSDPIEGVPEVHAEGQGGLLDVKLGPDFAETRHVYLTYAKATGPIPGGQGQMSVTAAGRGTLSEDLASLEGFEEIFAQEPPSPEPMHYGSRIVFDGEGHAFVTTGEHFAMDQRDKAQHLNATYGKVVRVGLDGSVPEDNPFVGQEDAIDTIWSYGHRNVQAAAYHDGQLWTIEHGPQGGDELNLTEAGNNYGWPVISYGERYGGAEVPIGSGESKMEGMEQPVYFWDPVIAPSGMVVYDGEAFSDWQGDILVGGLVSGGLVRLALNDDGRVEAEERILTDLGRVRDVVVLDDGTLAVATDYADGELIRITPADMTQ